MWNYQCLSLSAFRCSGAAEWSPWRASFTIFIRHLKSAPSYCLPSDILVLISQIQINPYCLLLTSFIQTHLYQKKHIKTLYFEAAKLTMTEQPNRLIGLLQKDTGYYRAHSSFCPTLVLLKSVLVLHLTLLSLFTQSYGRTGGSCFCLSVWKCLIFCA